MEKLVVLFALYTLVAGQGGKSSPPAYTTALETALRTEIFTGYSHLQRPMKQVQVNIELTLLTVNDLNIKDQSLSVSAQLSMKWQDFRLMWDSSTTLSQDYTNIKFLFSNENYMWRPCIFIENSVQDLSVISNPNTPMRLNQQGFVQWSPAGIYMVNCESDITYYPLDYQTCDLKLTTSSYTTYEIRLQMVKNVVNLDFYTKNGEWELLSATGMQSDDKARGGESFSSLTFRFHLRRRPLFHVLNTMFPVALMALLIPLTFKLHVDSGEKIGYSLTVLLAYAVYLSVISENIPSTSVSVCYMSIYLAAVLGVGTISVLFVIIVINVFHTPVEKPIPKWTRRFISLLMKIFCWKGTSCHLKSNKTETVEKTPVTEFTKTPSVMTSIDEVEAEDVEEETEMTWKLVAAVLDHLFFLIFMFVVLLSTVIFVSVIVLKYVTY